MNGFMTYLKGNYPNVRKVFGNAKPGTSSFDKAWKSLAQSQPKQFEKMQHNFIKSTHFDPASTSIKNTLGLDVSKRSKALQDVLWSVSVQHGAGVASKIFKRALGDNWKSMSEKQIIHAIYDERSANNGSKYFPSSSPSIRKSVVNRFNKERKDALNMLN